MVHSGTQVQKRLLRLRWSDTAFPKEVGLCIRAGPGVANAGCSGGQCQQRLDLRLSKGLLLGIPQSEKGVPGQRPRSYKCTQSQKAWRKVHDVSGEMFKGLREHVMRISTSMFQICTLKTFLKMF